MPFKDWERDVINRQRNIVFPDTVLNEGRLFRTLTALKNPRPVQRIGFVLLGLSLVIGGSWALAVAIGGFFSADNTAGSLFVSGFSALVGAGFLAFGILICIRALFSTPAPPRRRRRGYRRSSIE